MLELLKPITWFPPVWAFGCGVVSSGAPLAERWPLALAGLADFTGAGQPVDPDHAIRDLATFLGAAGEARARKAERKAAPSNHLRVRLRCGRVSPRTMRQRGAVVMPPGTMARQKKPGRPTHVYMLFP